LEQRGTKPTKSWPLFLGLSALTTGLFFAAQSYESDPDYQAAEREETELTGIVKSLANQPSSEGPSVNVEFLVEGAEPLAQWTSLSRSCVGEVTTQESRWFDHSGPEVFVHFETAAKGLQYAWNSDTTIWDNSPKSLSFSVPAELIRNLDRDYPTAVQAEIRIGRLSQRLPPVFLVSDPKSDCIAGFTPAELPIRTTDLGLAPQRLEEVEAYVNSGGFLSGPAR
jgi:hypothetical protein